jgi:hypothetical protein
VLSRLYERDYEGEALSLLYILAGFNEVIIAYRSAEKVPNACSLPEKRGCDFERKERIASFAETVETDPLKARLELKRFIYGKMLKKSPDTHPACTVCSECFYHILQEIEEKLSYFPEIPVLKRADFQCYSANMIENTSGEVALEEISECIPPEHIPPEHISPEHIPFSEPGNRQEERGKDKGFTDEFFDYESALKPHVRPPFSSSRVYNEAPENTEFLECYDINSRGGRKLEVSVYRYTDRP